jgi:hypothetical protein
MALQASGTIKYSQIIAEFGTPNNGGLGEYRLSGGENVGSLSNVPLDVGVPVTGEIKFSDFYNKRLNHIVDLHSIGNNTVRQDAKDRWNNGNVHIVGSSKTGRTQPPDTIDDRVIINVNKTIGSAKGTQTHCALKTGTWDSGTALVIEIGASGKLYGAGGNGGDGGSANNGRGGDGGTGSSALGIQYACTVNNLGVIQSGYGGGGGGGGREQTTGGGKKSPAVNNGAPGGGGGGGAGLPAGAAGICPDNAFGGGTNGDDGGAGTLSGQAQGGAGGNYGGDGGDSSPVNNSATKGDNGEVDNSTGGHGIGGSNGYAIITNQGSAPSITGGGSITGRTITSTNPT